MQTPYAKILASINGAANTFGGLVVENDDTVQLTPESTVGWKMETPPEWQLYSFTTGFSAPAGWSTKSVPQPDGSNATVYYYLGATPPVFSIPTATWWGKILVAFYVDGATSGALADATTTAFEVESPNGLHDTAHLEEGQFGGADKWVKPVSDNWHAIDDRLTEVVGAASYAAQAAWHIDPSAGDDANSGASSGAKIATWAEFRRRVGSRPIEAELIRIYDDLPETDPMRPPRRKPTGYLLIDGVATTLHTGSFTTVVSPVPSTNTPLRCTDSALSANWTTAGPASSSLLNKRVRITSGARAGAISEAIEDAGSKAAIFPTFVIPDEGTPGSYTEVTPQVGDPYVVESVPTVGAFEVDEPISMNVDGNCALLFARLKFSPLDTPFIPDSAYPSYVAFLGCEVGILRGSFTAVACIGGPARFMTGDRVRWIGGALTSSGGTATIEAGASVDFSGGALVNGTGLDVYGSMTWSETGLGIRNAPADGLTIQPGGIAQAVSLDAPLWGSGNAALGVHLYGTGKLVYDTTKPTLTGSSGDVSAGGDVYAWSEAPFEIAGGGAAILDRS